MKNFSAADLVPSRAKRPGYQIRKGHFIEDGTDRAMGAPVVDGLVIAVDEDVDHSRRIAAYSAMTMGNFKERQAANPHLKKTAWFFKYESGKWSFVGFGESLDSLWTEGDFAQP